MSAIEQAVRLADGTSAIVPTDLDDTRVCYWRVDAGGGLGWWIYLPRAGVGRLTLHTVVEHEDRTITVRPSIRLGARHGFLERGVWRDV
jgi:hypothetical protein